MRNKKKETMERLYSYDEFKRTFFPNPIPKGPPTSPDPKSFGRRLAEQALEKALKESHVNKTSSL